MELQWLEATTCKKCWPLGLFVNSKSVVGRGMILEPCFFCQWFKTIRTPQCPWERLKLGLTQNSVTKPDFDSKAYHSKTKICLPNCNLDFLVCQDTRERGRKADPKAILYQPEQSSLGVHHTYEISEVPLAWQPFVATMNPPPCLKLRRKELLLDS